DFLGLDRASDWMEPREGHIMGAHLSDASGLEAGLLPGAGTVDWGAVRETLSPTVPRILRLAPGTDLPMIREAIRWLEAGR
ncbi:MAG: hypothetical protein KDB53_04815, partial [Planctomycetes bacterium]|nr:hypothetical protein [Planctomycetota bacterium]